MIKTYVRLGLGIGIVAEMAMRDDPLGDLVVRPVAICLGKAWPAWPSSAAHTCAISSIICRTAQRPPEP